ncbi:hypothetical protein [Natrinema marinum]|uniref:hypothetical protein n=1 Tax=Natrinema marinum TaxID=2961598 RepID=UPI0020C89104|nr:hypothetical protein [Natrinema marinum]
MTLEQLVHGRRANAAIGWVLLSVVAVFALESVLTATLLWRALALLVVVAAAVPALAARDWTAMLPWPLLAVAGVGYASFRAFELHSEEIDVPSAFHGVFIVVFVLAAGVLWEVLEYALGDLVPVYGVDDIVTDFVFNGLGGLIVAIWGTGHVGELVDFFQERLRADTDR